MKSRIIILSLAVVFCSVSTITASAITSSDFKGKVVGKTWKWKKGKNKGTIVFSSSGGVKTTVKGKGKKKDAKDTGRWRWKNNRICIKYKTFAKGKERCAGLSRNIRGYKMSTGSLLY